jgi:hypothetical protein
MKKNLFGVIWVSLVLGSAITLSAQGYDINAYREVSRDDLARAFSPSWNPPPGEKGHYFSDMVGTFATCTFTFYYKASTNQYVPVSVGLAAKHYSACGSPNTLQIKAMVIRTDDMYDAPVFRYWIRGAANDFNPFTLLQSYGWEAESRCSDVNPSMPWNAAIRVTFEHFDGCGLF